MRKKSLLVIIALYLQVVLHTQASDSFNQRGSQITKKAKAEKAVQRVRTCIHDPYLRAKGEICLDDVIRVQMNEKDTDEWKKKAQKTGLSAHMIGTVINPQRREPLAGDLSSLFVQNVLANAKQQAERRRYLVKDFHKKEIFFWSQEHTCFYDIDTSYWWNNVDQSWDDGQEKLEWDTDEQCWWGSRAEQLWKERGHALRDCAMMKLWLKKVYEIKSQQTEYFLSDITVATMHKWLEDNERKYNKTSDKLYLQRNKKIQELIAISQLPQQPLSQKHYRVK